MQLLRHLPPNSVWNHSHDLYLFSWESDHTTLFNYLKGGCSQAAVGLFFQATRWEDSSLKLPQGRFRSDIRKNFFTERTTLLLSNDWTWHSVPWSCWQGMFGQSLDSMISEVFSNGFCEIMFAAYIFYIFSHLGTFTPDLLETATTSYCCSIYIQLQFCCLG